MSVVTNFASHTSYKLLLGHKYLYAAINHDYAYLNSKRQQKV